MGAAGAAGRSDSGTEGDGSTGGDKPLQQKELQALGGSPRGGTLSLLRTRFRRLRAGEPDPRPLEIDPEKDRPTHGAALSPARTTAGQLPCRRIPSTLHPSDPRPCPPCPAEVNRGTTVAAALFVILEFFY